MHPDLSKTEKKRLCGILDCQKLSPEVRAHAVKNELLPLRTVVQLLYFEQEKGSNSKGTTTSTHKLPKPHEILLGAAKQRPATRDSQHKQEFNGEVTSRDQKDHHKTKRADANLALDLERKMAIRGDIEETESQKVRGAKDESTSSCKLDLDPKKIIRRARSKSEHSVKRAE